MGRSLPDPGFRVVRSNAAPDLEPARIGGKGCLRLGAVGLIVLRITAVEENHMPAFESVRGKEGRVFGGGLLRDKIFTRKIAGIREGTADDLFYFSVMNVNTGSEFHENSLVYVNRPEKAVFLYSSGSMRPYAPSFLL